MLKREYSEKKCNREKVSKNYNLQEKFSFLQDPESITEEIKERLFYCNKAYYSNYFLFRNKLISKNAKMRLYIKFVLHSFYLYKWKMEP